MKNGTSDPSFAASFSSSSAARWVSKIESNASKNCRGIAAAPAQPGSYGNALVNLDARTELQTGVEREFVGRRRGQVVPARWNAGSSHEILIVCSREVSTVMSSTREMGTTRVSMS